MRIAGSGSGPLARILWALAAEKSLMAVSCYSSTAALLRGTAMGRVLACLSDQLWHSTAPSCNRHYGYIGPACLPPGQQVMLLSSQMHSQMPLGRQRPARPWQCVTSAVSPCAAVQQRCLHTSWSVGRRQSVDVPDGPEEEVDGFDDNFSDDEGEVSVYLDEDAEELDSEWVDGGVITTHHDSEGEEGEVLDDVEFDEAWEDEEPIDDLSELSGDEQ